MRLILNIIWLVFGGFWLALGYFLAALICFVLIVTIPFGVAAARIGVYALWPFGQTVVDKPGPRPGALVGNVIWLVLGGCRMLSLLRKMQKPWARTWGACFSRPSPSPSRCAPIPT